jgi:Tol biopolymer transport system component
MRIISIVFCAIVGGMIAPLVATESGQPNLKDANDQQIEALKRLDAEIDGWIVYTQQDRSADGGWMVRKMEVGSWVPQDLGPGRFARWSGDGRRLAVWQQDDRISKHEAVGSVYVMDANGENRRRLMADVVARQFLTGCPIDFHPDNQHVIVSKGRRRKDGTDGENLYLVDIDTGKAEKMDLGQKRGQTIDTEPQISADGRYLAVRTGGFGPKKRGGGQGELTVFDLKTKKAVVYGRGCMAGISADGQWLFNNFRGHNRITMHNLKDTGQKVFLTTDAIDENQWDAGHWSNHPEYFAIRGEGGPWAVYICHFTAEEQTFTRVTFNGGHCEYPDLYVSKAD